MVGISKHLWQVDEYLSLPMLLSRVVWGNRNPQEVITTRIKYGKHTQQYALLCLPMHFNHLQRTAVCFAHGGGWRMGNPDFFRFVGYFFARLGFPTILAGYRLAPAFKFPRQLEDVGFALETGLNDIKNMGLEVDQIILAGQSAGAQLASLLAYDRSAATRHRISQTDIAGLLLISGPLNFYLCSKGDISSVIADYVEDRHAWEQADPIRHIQGDETIPVLCIHGQKDPLVDIQNAFTFASQVKPGFSRVQVVMGAHHSDLANIFCTKDHPAAHWITNWMQRCIGQKNTVRTARPWA